MFTGFYLNWNLFCLNDVCQNCIAKIKIAFIILEINKKNAQCYNVREGLRRKEPPLNSFPNVDSFHEKQFKCIKGIHGI